MLRLIFQNGATENNNLLMGFFLGIAATGFATLLQYLLQRNQLKVQRTNLETQLQKQSENLEKQLREVNKKRK